MPEQRRARVVIARAPGWRWCASLTLALGSTAVAAVDAGLWFDGQRPGPQSHQAVELLASAPSQGLEPRDYDVEGLRQALARAAQDSVPDPTATARLELALTRAMERYLADLHAGRVDPRQIHHDFAPTRRAAFDPAAALQAALVDRRLPEAVRDAAPRLPQYQQLRDALAHYRALTDHPAWQQAMPPLPGQRAGQLGKLEPGQPYVGLTELAQRLAALGDLQARGLRSPLYESELVGAVESFQRRHGLAADGVIGRSTLAALEVRPAERVRQIELTLERLRWTPLLQGQRMIVINLPEFVLRAYEVRDGRIEVRLSMKVIVGKALDTRTPVLDEDMRAIEFSPYWNVPVSIARSEIAPRLRRDPTEFNRLGYEFVDPAGQVSTTFSPSALEAVVAGSARLRQRPGPRNPLGDIKFVFPNREHIYLHHTPSTRLFERDRRDFSHGCIRVEQPVALARFVLDGMPQWSEFRIREAMLRGQSSTLRLAEPVPVLIAYATALVLGGRVHFFQDLYGHDRVLDAALRQRAPDGARMNR